MPHRHSSCNQTPIRVLALVLGIAALIPGPATLADGPVPTVYDVRVDGESSTEALVVHFGEILRGQDPSSGDSIVVWIPEWHTLQIEGSSYTFHILGEHDPFESAWALTLDNVRFTWPPRFKDTAACDGIAKRVELRHLPDREADCSMDERRYAELLREMQEIGEGDPCWEAYDTNYLSCPDMFPKLEDASDYLSFDDIKGRPFLVADLSHIHDVIARCKAMDSEACGIIFSRYEWIAPTQHRTKCDIDVSGDEGSRGRDVDEQECVFHAFYEALDRNCLPPGCQARYRWRGNDENPIDNAQWQPVPMPPSIERHPRLLPAAPQPVTFLQRVQHCQEGHPQACGTVHRGYMRLNPGTMRTNCYMRIGGERKLNSSTVDAEECLFLTFYEALGHDCDLSDCEAAFVWQEHRTVPDSEVLNNWPMSGWIRVPSKPPLDQHRRRLDGNDW